MDRELPKGPMNTGGERYLEASRKWRNLVEELLEYDLLFHPQNLEDSLFIVQSGVALREIGFAYIGLG